VESYSCRQEENFMMAAPEAHHLFNNPIADHSFSADKSALAVARDNTVELYQRVGNKFTLKDELKGHDKTVTGVDIAPRSGRIVTCSQGMLSANAPF
jgi:actin related protein 2/3 complex subunit 1A/1B